jgi:hypothetical protein
VEYNDEGDSLYKHCKVEAIQTANDDVIPHKHEDQQQHLREFKIYYLKEQIQKIRMVEIKRFKCNPTMLHVRIFLEMFNGLRQSFREDIQDNKEEIA